MSSAAVVTGALRVKSKKQKVSSAALGTRINMNYQALFSQIKVKQKCRLLQFSLALKGLVATVIYLKLQTEKIIIFLAVGSFRN